MSDKREAGPMSTAEAAREYRRSLVENYHRERQGSQLLASEQLARGVGKRPVEAQLPASLRELIGRVRAEHPQLHFELLKYRHNVGEQVVTEVDDGAPLPSEDQLMVASVTTSVVIGDQITTEVHMLLAQYQNQAS